jgi:hypothetical protein
MKRLWDPPPGIFASGSHSAARRIALGSRAVLASKGSLRRARNRRALACCAPFCQMMNRDGRLRREPDTAQFLRLRKDENQMAVDKTS